MRRYLGLFVVLLAFTSIACPPAPPTEPPKKDEVKGDPLPTPVENVTQLRPRIEGALDLVRSRELTTQHGFWTVFHGILGMGLERTMLTDPKTRKKLNAIEYICDGGKLDGLEFPPTKDGLDVRTSFGGDDLQHRAQGHQDQFIAEMTQWGMRLAPPLSAAPTVTMPTMRPCSRKLRRRSW